MKLYDLSYGGVIDIQLLNMVHTAQYLLLQKLNTANIILDGTVGNGHDTLFLAKNSLPDAKIWAFDIQEHALHNSEKLLKKNNLNDKVTFIHDNHENIVKYIQPDIDIAMFNLGYLPGGNHDLATQPSSSVSAIHTVIHRLSVGGLLSTIVYPGHNTGYQEHIHLQKVFCALPQNIFTVGCWSMINHHKSPPVLYVIEKVRSEACENSASR